ncbi:NAD(P)H-dependent oxidoreductase [Terasakiella sp. A23]|uniref:NADPH-dependent FMN reductase n=1 Tax=Terasakiella sp. FCG-A23 TaxID=3080561 RepID=UPI002953987D|nr:NAD(P)H-dependent oxidoreductase [Terasakiella sp. A23]MDV7340320.1 NAD(P)H-dependent oxidoreductase [Terasakiella sp. A23]
MNVIAFAASSSQNSINKQLVTYATSLIKDADVEILDLNDYEMPLFSVDKEAELGKHPLAQAFLDKIAGADAIVISFAEHNGCYSAAYKNLFDWCSRINPKVYQDKPMVLLATSPGGRGGAGVLEFATKQMPFFKGDVKASLAIPSFNDNFDKESGVLKAGELHDQLVDALSNLS